MFKYEISDKARPQLDLGIRNFPMKQRRLSLGKV